jgi:hypothetical protein
MQIEKAAGPDAQTVLVPTEDSEDLIKLLFQQLTGKQNSLFQLFSRTALIDFGDIKQLKERLDQEFARFKIIGTSFNAEISLSDHSEVGLNSWEDFSKFDYGKKQTTSELSMKFQYIIRHGASPKPEQYIIEFSVRSFVSDLESIMISFSHSEENASPPSMRAKVEYVDYIIGKNVFQNIRDWVHSLRQVGNQYHYPFLSRHSSMIQFFLPRLGHFAPLFFAYNYAMELDVRQFDSVGIQWILVSGAVFIGTHAITQYTANGFRRKIVKTCGVSSIRLTAGDSQALDKIKDRNRGLFQGALARILSGIGAVILSGIGAVVVNLASNFIMKWSA